MSERKQTSNARAEKREAVLAPTRGGRRRVVLGLLVVAGAAAVVVALLVGRRPAGEERAAPDAVRPAPVMAGAGGAAQVRIPLADLAAGQAVFFDHRSASGGAPIRFFAIRDGDAYRAALDACEVCFHARKGYAQRGSQMVCRHCGNAYAPALIDESPGGCHPIGLPRTVDAGQLVVRVADVEAIHATYASRPPRPARPMPRGQ